jgi:hypothetical protein
MASVIPTGTPGALARMASTPARCARTITSFTWRRASRSRLPGGKAPQRKPMVDTMLGSLIVQARFITPASRADAFSQ